MLFAQFLYYLGALLSIPLLPIMYFQGKRVRKNIPRLPEAGLNTTGATAAGTAPPIRLLALGESTIAGVGVQDHAEGFTGRLSELLAGQTGRQVQWQVVAKSGYAAKDVYRKLVPDIPQEPFDCIVIGLGGNDTFYLTSPLGFRRDMGLLVRSLRERFPDTPIVIAALPPVGAFPGLPGLVRGGLGILVHLHSLAIRPMPLRFPGVYFPGRPLRVSDLLQSGYTQSDLFSDGIHPSALTYRLWAEETLRFMTAKGLLNRYFATT
jgi:lysophospholipase L1-like esterase